MSSLENTISNVLVQQDVELAQAIQKLQSDPAKLSEFVSARKAELYDTVTKEHSDNFQKVYGDLGRSTDVVKNILYYHTRNKDLDGLQKAIFDKAKSEADAATFDSQNAKRQFEINEWTASNKGDTLFFLQLLFITLTITAPLLYMSRLGWIPNSVFYGLITLLTIALVLTLVVRIIYTTDIRDNRFWNRRRFAQMGGPPTPPTCESIQEISSRLQTGAKDLTSQAQDLFDEGSGRVSAAYNILTAGAQAPK
jgi:hypothetical protein